MSYEPESVSSGYRVPETSAYEQEDELAEGDLSFERIEDSQLDHLAGLDDRKEQLDVRQGRWRNKQPNLVHLTPEQQSAALRNFQFNCDLVVSGAKVSVKWSAPVVSQFEGILHSKAKAETPLSAHYATRDDAIARIDAVVRSGLCQFTGLHVETYGSYTSGLFTPNGDLDIAIEGTLQLRSNFSGQSRLTNELEGLDVSELHKDEKADLLRFLMKALMRSRICNIRPHGIFHARVPIVKFVEEKSGIPCDMAVGSKGARFKSTVLRQLSQIDSRFPDLMRVVKLWAKAWHVNDASNGTLNTFALALMVIFHLQTRSPPILPPICELFDQSPEELEGRPLHAGSIADPILLQSSEQRAMSWRGRGNKESLVDLLHSFFAVYTNAIGMWVEKKEARAIRCCTWKGKWSYLEWRKVYIMPIEDPFDATDNCARSVFQSNSRILRNAFEGSLVAFQDMQDSSFLKRLLATLFDVKAEPTIQHPFLGKGGQKMAWRDGWARRQTSQEHKPSVTETQGNGHVRLARRQGSQSRNANRSASTSGREDLPDLPVTAIPGGYLPPPGIPYPLGGWRLPAQAMGLNGGPLQHNMQPPGDPGKLMEIPHGPPGIPIAAPAHGSSYPPGFPHVPAYTSQVFLSSPPGIPVPEAGSEANIYLKDAQKISRSSAHNPPYITSNGHQNNHLRNLFAEAAVRNLPGENGAGSELSNASSGLNKRGNTRGPSQSGLRGHSRQDPRKQGPRENVVEFNGLSLA